MDVTSLNLNTYLVSKRDAPIMAFVKLTYPAGLMALPNLRAVVCQGRAPVPDPQFPFEAKVVVDDWVCLDTWREELKTELNVEGKGIAVFISPYDDIRLEVMKFLAKKGFREIVYLSNGEWQSVSVVSALERFGNSVRKFIFDSVINLRKAKQNAARSAIINARRFILKKHGINLHDFWPDAFVSDGGYRYRVYAPQFAGHFDSVGCERNEYALFEEVVRLRSHCGHEAIAEEGMGQSALWESDILFSSTDGTDPNTLYRRFRLVKMSGLNVCYKYFLQTRPLIDVTDRSLDTPIYCEQTPAEIEEKIAGSIGDIGRTIVSRCPSRVEKFWNDAEAMSQPRGFLLNNDFVPGRIVHFIGSLAPGGSERQLTYTVRGLKEKGKDVSVLVPAPDPTRKEFLMHYQSVIEEAGIPVRCISGLASDFQGIRKLSPQVIEDMWLLHTLPAYLKKDVAEIYSHLHSSRPQVFHAWLDFTNITGAIAAVLAGVPQIYVSCRSMNSTHFPRVHHEWFQEWYEKILRCDRVTMINNSAAGAESYGSWIGYPVERIEVIHNGIDPETFPAPSCVEIDAFRNSVGIPKDAPVVSGIFRLTSEKRPLRFLRVLAGVMTELPELHIAIAGEGPLIDQVRREVANLQLTDRVHLLGRRRDVHMIIAASDLVLLTSTMEGFPNVLLEAQWLGCPVVAPRVGGIPEVVLDGIGGLLFDREDVSGMTNGCIRLLTNRLELERFSRAGSEFVKQHFLVANMVEKTVRLYSRGGAMSDIPLDAPEVAAVSM